MTQHRDFTEISHRITGLTPGGLPDSPFELHPGLVVRDAALLLASLQRELAEADTAPRARTGALQADCAALLRVIDGQAPLQTREIAEEKQGAPPPRPEGSKPEPPQALNPPPTAAPPAPSPSPTHAAAVAPESHAAPSGEDVLVAFDLETTGLSPQNACIIEVGAVKFSPSGEKLGTFQEFCSPGAPIPEEVVKLTGITDDMVTGAKPPLEVVEAFLEWATPPAIYIAHNAEFDLGFLRGAFTRAARKAPEWRVVDTLVWAQSLKLGTPNCKLGTLLEHYRIHADGPLHRSLADATGVMELVLRFTEGQLDPLALITERIGLLPQRRRRRAFV